MIGFLSGWKGYAIVAFMAGALAWAWQANSYGTQIADIEADRARERRDQALAQVKAVDGARLEEQRRTNKQTEIANVAIQQAESARADARASDAAHRELLARATALANASRRPDDSAPIGGSTAAADAVGVLANVLGRCSERASILGRYADAARIAGQACERSFDALTQFTN